MSFLFSIRTLRDYSLHQRPGPSEDILDHDPNSNSMTKEVSRSRDVSLLPGKQIVVDVKPSMSHTLESGHDF